MNRLEHLREVIDEILRQQPDQIESRCGFIHLYGVAAICAMLALKRGLDPELCSTAGMLHDIWNYKIGCTPEHAKLGASEADKMLRELGSYTDEEILAVTSAILHHGAKHEIHGDICEVLKDADVLQHHLYNTAMPLHEKLMERLNNLRKELDLI